MAQTTPTLQTPQTLQTFTDSIAPTGPSAEATDVVTTPADRHELFSNAKNPSGATTRGQKTKTPEIFQTSGALNDLEADESVAKGRLAAEALLSARAITPTGAQAVVSIAIPQHILDRLAPLRKEEPTALHNKLGRLVSALQAQFGTRNSWPDAQPVGPYYALVDPLRVSQYLANYNEVEDFSDLQAQECFCPMTSIDGLPVIDGLAIWDRLQWEQVNFYNLFKLFRDMGYSYLNECDVLTTPRSIAQLSKASGVGGKMLNYLSRTYHWAFRVAQYDEWMVQQRIAREEIKRRLMLDRHTQISQGLITKAYAALNAQADKMSAKDAIALLELGFKYERLSLNLSPDKPVGAGNSGGYGSSDGTQINIVNQSNAGPVVQVTPGVNPEQALNNNMKKPDALLSVLHVLQNSNAFNAALSGAAPQAESAIVEAEFVENVGMAESPTVASGETIPEGFTHAPPREPLDPPELRETTSPPKVVSSPGGTFNTLQGQEGGRNDFDGAIS